MFLINKILANVSIFKERQLQKKRSKSLNHSKKITVVSQSENLVITQLLPKNVATSLIISDGKTTIAFSVVKRSIFFSKKEYVTAKVPHAKIIELQKLSHATTELECFWEYSPPGINVSSQKSFLLKQQEMQNGISKAVIIHNNKIMIPVGAASRTIFPASNLVEHKTGKYWLKTSTDGYLVFQTIFSHTPNAIVFADGVRTKNNKIFVAGRVHLLAGAITSARFIWRSRTAQVDFSSSANVIYDNVWSVYDQGKRNFIFQSSITIPQDLWKQIDSGEIFDAYLVVRDDKNNAEKELRISRVPYITRVFNKESIIKHDSRILIFLPHYTFKTGALSLRIEHFPQEVSSYLPISKKITKTVQPHTEKHSEVWLFGEKPDKAQDNGLHFFKWIKENKPEIEAYYVIDSKSVDVANLEDYEDSILLHASSRHFEKTLIAKKILGTHHPDYLYPTRFSDFVQRIKAKQIFLQHGVMGTKWMQPNYGTDSDFATDLVLCSSDYEREYLISDFGYAPSQVAVTGLSRFDRLFAHNNDLPKKDILIIPTWRDWLLSTTDVTASTYFQSWSNLLHQPGFQNLINELGLTVTFCLHPNMQKYHDFFHKIGPNIVISKDPDIQDLLLNHKCLITDYSSVGFDFSFINKPVIYYQFDKQQFFGRYGSHINVEEELPGYIFETSEPLIKQIEHLANENFPQVYSLQRKAQKFLKYKDTRNNQRIYRQVLEL